MFHAPLKGRSILIVEDEFIIALELETIISEAGAMVVGPAATCAEGLSYLEAAAIDLAILDFRLDGDTSMPIAEKLRACGIPFLIHTGQGEPAEVVAAWPDVPILHKPVLATVLVQKIAQMLPPLPLTRRIA